MHQLTQRPDASGSQSSSRCAMRACESSQFFSSLIALLAPLVGGVGYTTAPNTEGIVDKPATRVVFPDEITQQPRSRALEEVDTGPDPFFADLVDRTPFVDPDLDEGTAVANKEPPRTYYVEVYENEYRGLGWRWRELRHGRSLANLRWSYKVCALQCNGTAFCCVLCFVVVFYSSRYVDISTCRNIKHRSRSHLSYVPGIYEDRVARRKAMVENALAGRKRLGSLDFQIEKWHAL